MPCLCNEGPFPLRERATQTDADLLLLRILDAALMQHTHLHVQHLIIAQPFIADRKGRYLRIDVIDPIYICVDVHLVQSQHMRKQNCAEIAASPAQRRHIAAGSLCDETAGDHHLMLRERLLHAACG